MNLTATVEGEEAADPDDFYHFGTGRICAEFDQKLTGVSAGDKLILASHTEMTLWQEDWQENR